MDNETKYKPYHKMISDTPFSWVPDYEDKDMLLSKDEDGVSLASKLAYKTSHTGWTTGIYDVLMHRMPTGQLIVEHLAHNAYSNDFITRDSRLLAIGEVLNDLELVFSDKYYTVSCATAHAGCANKEKLTIDGIRNGRKCEVCGGTRFLLASRLSSHIVSVDYEDNTFYIIKRYKSFKEYSNKYNSNKEK